MKAWILEKQSKIEEKPLNLGELPTPHAGEGEIRMRVLVCGICRTDIHIAEGDLPLKKAPLVLGHEVVGVIDEVGSDVERFEMRPHVLRHAPEILGHHFAAAGRLEHHLESLVTIVAVGGPVLRGVVGPRRPSRQIAAGLLLRLVLG